MDGCYDFGLCICFGWYRFVLIDCYVISFYFGYFWTNVIYSDFDDWKGELLFFFYDEGGDIICNGEIFICYEKYSYALMQGELFKSFWN